MKAVVLETRDREAAVLVNDGTVRIVRGAYNVGDIIDCRIKPLFYQWVAAAIAMVVLMGGSAGLWIDRNYVTYAEVSLDVNPSIVYSLNKRDRVLNVRAANEDAESVVAELEQDGVRFATLPDAVDRTMALLEDEGFLNEEQADYVLINVSADDVERQNRLSEEVEAAMMETQEQNPTTEYRIDQSDRKTARKAQDEGMSAGRYSAWQQAGDGSDKQDYADKPVRELMGHAPVDDQPDSLEMPDSSPGDSLQSPPSGEAMEQEQSGPTQGKEASESPSDAQAPTPGEKPSYEIPSGPQTPVNEPATNSDVGTQPPSEDLSYDEPSGVKEPSEAAGSSPREPAESDKVPVEQTNPKPVSSEKSESVPKQDPSSNADKTFAQSGPGSGRTEQPKTDVKQSSPREPGSRSPGNVSSEPKR